MPFSEKFLAARAAEQRQRLLNYLPQALPLRLPLANGRVVSVPQMHVTLRSTDLDLRLIGSPFIVGGRATRPDAWRYLWRHHPAYPGREAGLLGRLRAAAARLHLAWICGRLMWPAAAYLIKERIDLADMDAPPAETGSCAPSLAAPPCCIIDDLRVHFAAHGISLSELLDQPKALLLQFVRAEALAAPDGELDVIDPSDALMGS